MAETNGLVTEADDGELISIGRLAREIGVSSRTIRYYEELGILPVPPRSSGGTRKYPREYRFYIEGALALKGLGFSLDEIKLIGRLALHRPMTTRQQKQALEVVHEKMDALEHKIEVLNRLRKILQQTERSTSSEPLITQLIGEGSRPRRYDSA